MGQLMLTNEQLRQDGLTDEQYELADRLEPALEAAGADGLTPSGAGKKTGVTTSEAKTVLDWMVGHQYAHTDGRGAWSHYYTGRAR